jgi:hypothetical protein
VIPNLPPAEAPYPPYDILLVNSYISNGLYRSRLDNYFEDSASSSSSKSVMKDDPISVPVTLHDIALNARSALKDLRNRREGSKVCALIFFARSNP